MSVEDARAAYLAAVKRSGRARHSLIVRSKELKEARKVHIQVHTKATRAAYRKAKRVRARRYRNYKRAQSAKWAARRRYKVAARLAQQPLRVRALHEARSLLGVVEQGGNNTGPVVDKIIQSSGGIVGQPWCGYFVAYCYRQAGSTVVTRAWAAAWAGVWGWFSGVKRVKNLRNMRPGHIVEYQWQHTGIFERWTDDSRTTFQCVEGNTGTQGNTSDTTADGVHRRIRNISDVKGAFSPTR